MTNYLKTTAVKSVEKTKPNKSKSAGNVPYSSDDYVIASINGKNKLGLIIGKNKFLPEEGAESDTAETLKIEPSQVLCNLGKAPKRGITALGVKVNPYEFTIVDDFWGNIHFYITFKTKKGKEDRRLRYFKKCLTNVQATLEKHGCTNFLPITMRVFENTKKSVAKVKAGCYRYKPKGQDIMEINEVDFTDKDLTSYCLYHESAHGIWFRLVPNDIKLEWIDCFNQRLEVVHSNQKRMEQLCLELASHEDGFKHYMKNCCNDVYEFNTITEAFAYIKRIHKLSISQVQNYVESRGRNALTKFWPSYSDIVKPNADITEYAMTNHEEFFAEAFAHYFSGKTLPKDVKKLVKKTLKNLVNRH
tara:strand:+ start:6638 stop:7717 length:1080 start_codon:yes stop_codon:yes gene_type:complete